jgi:hypothetical protein
MRKMLALLSFVTAILLSCENSADTVSPAKDSTDTLTEDQIKKIDEDAKAAKDSITNAVDSLKTRTNPAP